MLRGADISACGRYRYTLLRRWDADKGCVAFVGLNPSTADGQADDPTIRRCVGFAQAWGFGALAMVNLFAWRATQPQDMRAQSDPIGPANDYYLKGVAARADLVVAAWGTHGSHCGRDLAVRQLLPRLHVLKLTKGGQPAHPLYLPGRLRPMVW